MAEQATANRTRDGRKVSTLRLVNEISCEARAIRVKRRLNSDHVIEVMAELMLE